MASIWQSILNRLIVWVTRAVHIFSDRYQKIPNNQNSSNEESLYLASGGSYGCHCFLLYGKTDLVLIFSLLEAS